MEDVEKYRRGTEDLGSELSGVEDDGSGRPLNDQRKSFADPMLTPANETVLVKRMKEHDERAFAEFVQAFQHQVFNLIYRMLGNREEAEDVAQEVFITIYKNVESFRGECRLSTWIYRICTNHCRNRIKYNVRRHTQEHREYQDEMGKLQPRDGHASAPTAGQVERPDQMAEGRQMEQLVQQAITELDEEHREVIVLRDIKNLSYQEICDITGLAEGTVKSRLHRARFALKDKLKDVI